MLEVKGISRFYGDQAAIEGISFCAEPGQVVGLVGHNGSGKTTTMNIITNCLAPSSGEVSIEGISVQDNPLAARKRIGYLPEIPPVYPDMTVEEQLTFACGLRGLSRREYKAQIAGVCDSLNLSGVRKRLIRNLSKGYCQRVGFAQALIGHPRLLVLDEPTVGLDPQQIIELRELIGRLKQDHTILLSSHILSEIAATCDRIVVLSNWRLAADDTQYGLLLRARSQEGLLLKADGPEAQISAIIRSLDAVADCTMQPSGADGHPTWHIRTHGSADIHRELFSALAAAGCPIRMLRPVQVGLEDVFLQLTQDRRYAQHSSQEVQPQG